MSEKISIPIGDGTSLDGGPFFASTITDHDEETIRVDDDTAAPAKMPRFMLSEIEDEIQSNEPVTINSHGIDRDEMFTTVRVPLYDWLLFETDGQTATGEELKASGDLRRRFKRSFRKHGGSVRENY